MSSYNTAPNRNTRIIALSAAVLAVVGGLSLFDTANGETETATAVTEPAAVIATSCSGFGTDAHELFDKRGNAVLSGGFQQQLTCLGRVGPAQANLQRLPSRFASAKA